MGMIEELITKNASAVFSLLSVITTGLITFFSTKFIKKHEYNLNLYNVMLKKRIKAHDNLIEMAIEMRATGVYHGTENNSEEIALPVLMCTQEHFKQWFTKFSLLTQKKSTWLTVKAKREMYYVQDYLTNLDKLISRMPSSQHESLGHTIKPDFIVMSSDLEEKAFSFFEKDIYHLKLKDFGKWHKYPKSITENRLKNTRLFKEVIDKMEKI